MKLITFLLLFQISYGLEFLISNYDFTNQEYTFEKCNKFLDTYTNKFTKKQRLKIYNTCKKYNINFLVVCAKIQKETSLIINSDATNYLHLEKRCMGYGLYITAETNGIKYKWYEDFDRQIEYGIKSLYKNYSAYKQGYKNILYTHKKKTIELIPENAATYALYIYTPFYETAYDYWGVQGNGNQVFIKCYRRLKEVWDNL